MEFLALFIAFAVISKILEALGGGKKKPPPRGRLPRDPRTGRPQPRSPTQRSETGTAADMLPDELWELLTGEKRQAPAAPKKAPVEVLDEEVEEPRVVLDEEAEADRYIAAHRRDEGEIERTLESRRQAALQRLERIAVPEERRPPTEKVRHAQFHEKIDRPAATARPAPSVARGLGLEGPSDLRRAFVLSEVLGRPKALQEEDSPHV